MEATVILTKCPKTRRMFGVRIHKMDDGDWWRTWAFPIEERRAKCEGYDLQEIKGNLYSTDKYPGCPYCGTYGFVQCGHCGKLSCYNGEDSLDCMWCGNEMINIVTAEDGFNVNGGDI